MLPAESHATSVGRLKFSPSAPDPGGGPPARRCGEPRRRRRPARAGGCRRSRPDERVGVGRHRQRQVRHAHRLGLAAEDHLDPPVRVELDHLRRHLIDDPDVVLRIDAHLLRLQEPVDALADLAHELAGAIELEQPRAAVRRRSRDPAVVIDRRAGPRVDEDVALRVRGHAGRFAQVDVRRERERRGRVVRDLREVQLRGQRAGRAERRAATERDGLEGVSWNSSLTGSRSWWSGAGGSSARARR